MHRGVSFYSRVFLCAAVLAFAFGLWSTAAQAAPCVEPQNCAQPPGATNGQSELPPSQGVAGQQASGGKGGHHASEGSEASPGSAGTAAVGGSGGSLPFTGYPMIVLVWVVLALVVAGAVIRLGLVPRRRRLAEDRTR